jgi:transcriptional regulator with XRE-family HTH domain
MDNDKLNFAKLRRDIVQKRADMEIEHDKFISYRDMAKLIGIDQATFTRTLHGKSVPDTTNLGKICKFLGNPIEEYLN